MNVRMQTRPQAGHQQHSPWTSARRWGAVLSITALLMAGCGGGSSGSSGSSSGSNSGSVSAVKVFGDSLADSGTYKKSANFRVFTVQGSDSEPDVIWSERVAKSKNAKAASGTGSLCNFYEATGASTFGRNSVAGCTSYAVGGGVINQTTIPVSPLSILQQLSDAKSGMTSDDLVLIDGGGNDAAAVVQAYLTVLRDASSTALTDLLATIPNSQYTSLLTAGKTQDAINLYMKGLADKLFDAVKSNVLDRGVRRVVLVNMPDITLTPRMAGVFNALGDTNGPVVKTAVKAWEQAYNTQLSTRATSYSDRVLVVDLYDFMQKQATSGAYTNTTTPACPQTGTDNNEPTYNFATCTATALSDSQPSDQSPRNRNWWTTYLYSDSFHPTPRAHAEFGTAVIAAISQKGW